jgi:flagellar protein FlaI
MADKNQEVEPPGTAKPTGKWVILEKYDIEPPNSSVQIIHNVNTDENMYIVNEETVSSQFEVLLNEVKKKFSEGISHYPETEEERTKYIGEKINEYLGRRKTTIPSLEIERINYEIYRDFEGYGIIHVPERDKEVEDISCSGPDGPVYVFHHRYGSMRSNIVFKDDHSLNRYIGWLVQRSGKHISISNPMVDCSLPDGSRLQATYGREVTKRGPSFSIRRFSTTPLSPIDLLNSNTFSEDIAVYIWFAVERGMNMFIIGGTASGKTTTLNSSILFIPPEKKIVSVEDTREINIPNDNWIPLVTRHGIGDVNPVSMKKMGEVDMFDLLVSSLRQRPDYIVVGEVRGPEAYTVFQAMATGQTAYSTFHADSVLSFVHRLEGEPIKIPKGMMTSVDAVIVQALNRTDKGILRRVKEIVEFVGFDQASNEIITNRVFEWSAGNDSFIYGGHSNIYDKIMKTDNLNLEMMNAEIERRRKVLRYCIRKGINGYTLFASVVNAYYKDPEALLRKIDAYSKDGRNEENSI